jgi:hypothetical protein
MATNSVIYKTGSVTLDWSDIAGANKYHLQVAVTPDFSGTLLVDDNTLAVSTKAFTDSGTDNMKRFWRVRYSTDGGTTWQEWGEVGSYWLYAAFANEMTLSTEKWRLINPVDVTDYYEFEVYPLYGMVFENIFRARDRNRLGTMISEFVTTKAKISMTYPQGNFIPHSQYRAFRRFNEVVKTFFLACYKFNEVDYVPNIWKCQFESDPVFSMLTAGRPGLLTGNVSLIEV